MRKIKTREGFEFWDKLNALPRYAFLLSPSGKSVQKFEDQAMGNWIDVHEAQKIVDQAQERISELLDERAAQPQPDPILCKFYDVADWPGLVRELVGHVSQLQDSAKRNVKPWEDTFPPTLLPAYIERVNADNAAVQPQGEPYGWVQTRGNAINQFTQEWDVVESWQAQGFEYKAMFDHAAKPQGESVACAICLDLGDQCMECEEAAFVSWADRHFASADYRKTDAGVYRQDWMRHAFAAWQARKSEQPAPVAVLPERLQQVLKFLDGAENLDGHWFGEPHPSGRSYWWRNELRKAIDETNLFAKQQ